MRISKFALGIATAAAIFVAGCATSNTYTEEEIGLRKTDLYSENTTVADKTMYAKTGAGESGVLQRSFENAPPMIPHSVEGMLPVKISNNMCVTCHMPDVAPALKATAVPASHLTNYRPATSIASNGKIVKDEIVIKN